VFQAIGVKVLQVTNRRDPWRIETGAKPRATGNPEIRRRKEMFKNLKAKMRNEEGQGLVEYALIIFMVSIAVIVILPQLGTRIAAIFQQIVTALTA
jgi:pilus assembly protein Flp/PilA